MPTATKINVLTPIITQLAGQLPQIAALAAASPSTTAPVAASDPIVPILNSLAGTSTALLTLAQGAGLSTKAVSAITTALPLMQAAVANATSGTSPPVQSDAVNMASTAGNLLASIATQIAATNVNIDLASLKCVPTQEDLNDFQKAYVLVDPTFKVTGVYDTATATAIAKTLNIPVSTCPTSTTPPPTPPLNPLPPGGSTTTTTTTTTTVAAANNTALYVVGGVAALSLGALLLKLHQSNRLVRSTRR